MKANIQEIQGLLINEKSVVLNFFKSKFPIFHNSNIFFRDVQFVIQSFLELRGYSLTYSAYEKLTVSFMEALVQDGTAVQVNPIGWKLNYPEFKHGAAPAETPVA